MKNIEVYVSGLFILVGAVICWQASLLPYYSEFGPGSGFLPLWASGIMIILCLFNTLVAFKQNNTHFDRLLPTGTSLKNVAACIGGYVLFMIIIPYVGFTISSVIMLFILFSRGYQWHWALGWSVVVTGVVFFVFSSLLGVPLPVNDFGW